MIVTLKKDDASKLWRVRIIPTRDIKYPFRAL
nr:MAG TPA: hypothetical protein [Caudoviricetes sp.]